MKPALTAVSTLAVVLMQTTPAHAQDSSLSVGLAVTHALTSTASSRSPCSGVCRLRSDVLSPVVMSTVELEVALPLNRTARSGVEVVARAVPLALVQNNPTVRARRDTGGRGWTIPASAPRASTTGVGLKPLGLRGWLGPDAVHVVGEASVGFVRFGTPLLAANAARFNFVFDVGLGVRLDVWGRRATVGYRRHHASNAGFGEVNPGLNSHVLYVALSWS